ncbi:hypothetical protein AKJ16_DCAP19111 [Drosera capensis]
MPENVNSPAETVSSQNSVSNMPSLWRKSSSSPSKGNRISRFVAYLQTPPKRGGSLVVETGFPTSLVDLFDKNRDRIKKQKKKRVSNPPSIDSDSTPASLALSSCDSQSIRFCNLGSPSRLVSRDEEVLEVPECSNLLPGESDDVGCPAVGIEEIKEVRSSKNVAYWMLKVKVAAFVILALCTKKLVLGMAIAACLLLLIEYMGDWLLGSLNRCRVLGDRLRWVGFGRERKRENEEVGRGERCGATCDPCDFIEKVQEANEDKCCHIDEIEVEHDISGDQDGIQEIRRPCSGRVVIEETWSKEMVGEGCEMRNEVCENVKGKKGKFWKRFVMKLDKKKMKKKKKKKDKKGKQIDEDVGIAKSSELEEDLDEQHDQSDIITEADPPSFPYEEQNGVGSSTETTQPHYYEKEDGKLGKRSNRKDQSMKYMFMMMIALAGLLLGRIAALVLTLSCCLAFKMARCSAR